MKKIMMICAVLALFSCNGPADDSDISGPTDDIYAQIAGFYAGTAGLSKNDSWVTELALGDAQTANWDGSSFGTGDNRTWRLSYTVKGGGGQSYRGRYLYEDGAITFSKTGEVRSREFPFPWEPVGDLSGLISLAYKLDDDQVTAGDNGLGFWVALERTEEDE